MLVCVLSVGVVLLFASKKVLTVVDYYAFITLPFSVRCSKDVVYSTY